MGGLANTDRALILIFTTADALRYAHLAPVNSMAAVKALEDD